MGGIIRAVDLFAGIGGIRLGFEAAFGGSVVTVFVSEWDSYARTTYAANFRDGFAIAGDITKVREEDVPPSISVWPGFPARRSALRAPVTGSRTIFTV